MSARPLPCRAPACPGVLGWVDGDGVLKLAGTARLHCDLAAGRCVVACPACGTEQHWRGPAVAVGTKRRPAA